MDDLVIKTMNILGTKDDKLARQLVSEIANALETELCKEMQDQCADQEKSIAYYIEEKRRLLARITELELSSGYRTGATDALRSMEIGEKKYFPAGDKYEKLGKRLWNIANAARMKIKCRSIQKNGMIYVKVTRIA